MLTDKKARFEMTVSRNNEGGNIQQMCLMLSTAHNFPFSLEQKDYVMCRKSVLLLQLLSWLACAMALPASWMSGKWGVGLRTPAGGIALPVINNLNVPYFNVTALVQQVKSMGASWLIINLSSGASGDTYISYHPVLYEINPGSTPANVSNGGRDLFGEIAAALNASGIACIAYAASEGPAMLKGGASQAYDASIGSPSVTNWANWVQAKYGSSDLATLKIAYAMEIAQYYANRYGDLINGWWFDQSNYANIPLLRSIVKTANPNTVAIFNDGVHVPLFNSQPGLEDATAGVPSQLTTTLPNSYVNYPMITSVENSSGWLSGPSGELALGHVFMPFGNSWNAIGTQNVWNQTQAVDWMGRVLVAGGAWTWNLPRQTNGAYNQPDTSVMSYSIVSFVNNVVAALPKAPTKTPTVPPSIKPSVWPTASPTITPTELPSKTPTIAPTHLATLVPSHQPSMPPSFAKHSLSPSEAKATPSPSGPPTSAPSSSPSSLPTTVPSLRATAQPSTNPSGLLTDVPSIEPSTPPSSLPSSRLTSQPTHAKPTSSPSLAANPTDEPSVAPSLIPTVQPSTAPSLQLIENPSSSPSSKPTNRPTHFGRTSFPTVTKHQTDFPSATPSQFQTVSPSNNPSTLPTGTPSQYPTSLPTLYPTVHPTTRKPSSKPSNIPTAVPTVRSTSLPTSQPSRKPSLQPVGPSTARPTSKPSSSPTVKPTFQPSRRPPTKPTNSPTRKPTAKPTASPTSKPTKTPTKLPTTSQSKRPSTWPTPQPTRMPTAKPTNTPTAKPTAKPSASPTRTVPSKQPTRLPTKTPTSKPGKPVQIKALEVVDASPAELNGFCADTLNVCGPNKLTFCHKRGNVFMTKCIATKQLKSRFGANDYCGCCSATDALQYRPTYCEV